MDYYLCINANMMCMNKYVKMCWKFNSRKAAFSEKPIQVLNWARKPHIRSCFLYSVMHRKLYSIVLAYIVNGTRNSLQHAVNTRRQQTKRPVKYQQLDRFACARLQWLLCVMHATQWARTCLGDHSNAQATMWKSSLSFDRQTNTAHI